MFPSGCAVSAIALPQLAYTRFPCRYCFPKLMSPKPPSKIGSFIPYLQNQIVFLYRGYGVGGPPPSGFPGAARSEVRRLLRLGCLGFALGLLRSALSPGPYNATLSMYKTPPFSPYFLILVQLPAVRDKSSEVHWVPGQALSVRFLHDILLVHHRQ